MNIINVKAIKTGDRSAKVLWHIGKERNGAIDVYLPFDSDSVEALGELAVLRHLTLEDPQLPGPLRSGKGIRAVVTKGAIKKAMKGKSAIASMKKYSRFLTGRLKGIELEVKQKGQLIPDDDTPATQHIELNLEPHETIDTPVMGLVQITDHAYGRWLERVEERSQERPFDSLVRRLQSPELSPVSLPDKVIKSKIRKYGENGVVRVYRHPTEPIHFGVIESEGVQALVTVFVRTDTLISAKN